MPQVTYKCYFTDWDSFMDGELIIENENIEYDFVSQEQADDEGNSPDLNILNPFNEEEARKHFAAQGYDNIKFIYEEE